MEDAPTIETGKASHIDLLNMPLLYLEIKLK